MKRSLFTMTTIFVIYGFTTSTTSATAREQRLILDLKTKILASDTTPIWVPRILLRLENRSHSEEITYEQLTFGLTHIWKPWLVTALYTTPREVFSSDKPNQWKNVHGADVIGIWSFKNWSFLDRETLEWHVSDDFLRNRNQIEVRFRVYPQVQLFGLYEWRWDFDVERLNMQTAAGGVFWQIRSNFAVRLMFAEEWNRRNLPQWDAVWFTSFILSMLM